MSVAERMDIDLILVRMISIDFQPLSIIENKAFINYSKKLDPRYTLRSRKVLSTKLLEMKKTVRNHVEKLLNSVHYVAVTTDMWTSDSALPYLTVTMHFVSEFSETSLHSLVLKTSHTVQNIASSLEKVLHKWNILHKYSHLSCVANTSNLIVNDAINETDPAPMLKKCCALVSHFKSSSTAAEKIRNMHRQMGATELKLKQDVSTRWNSCLLMLERLLVVKEPLSAAISSLPYAPESLDGCEREIIVECLPLLKLIEIMTAALSGEKYPTISIVLPLVRGVQLSVKRKQHLSTIAQNLKSSLLSGFSKRLGTIETNEIVSKATILDAPNRAQKEVSEELAALIKKDQWTEKISSGGSRTSGETAATVLEETDSSSSKHVSSSTLMLRQYLEMPHVDRKGNSMRFWFSQKKQHT
ncbi:hypothetical protein PR048_013153 [Dryococelus australis]|uniref:Zinc finger BED domain-containing protein 4 n=1 Tax=Dryococelus australis TaxID=614101 RepID=A0ABQ9HRD3_9NEOP|nr:hypothetical protein PR048_013153 [Dryococelus australis]